VGSGALDEASRHLGPFLTRAGPDGRLAPAAWGDPWEGRSHASMSPTGGRPATPLRLGRHEGGPDEQHAAPDQADGDVAALATRIRCAVARRRSIRRLGRRSVRRPVRRRAGFDTRVLTFDLYDDRPALSVRELLTDEDLAVVVLVGSIAADPYRVVARLEPLVNAGGPDVLASWRGRRAPASRTRPGRGWPWWPWRR
jgi:hypothetical protein